MRDPLGTSAAAAVAILILCAAAVPPARAQTSTNQDSLPAATAEPPAEPTNETSEPPGASEAPEPSSSPATPATVPVGGSSLLNPNISAIGWFQAEVSEETDEQGSSLFELREVELAFQAAVDPYSRADIFVAVSPEEGVDLEEGYLTLLTLPAGFTAKLGKFRSHFGKFNRTHPPETPFADRPLVAERFFGEEGLAAVGVSASWLAPLPFYFSVDGEVTNTPEEIPSFEPYRGVDLLYLARVSSFLNLSETTNVTLGFSAANGAHGADAPDTLLFGSDVGALRSWVYGGDVTLRWKNPRRAIYRSLVAQLEIMKRDLERFDSPDEEETGGFAYADYQFARRWHLGARYDWLDDPDRSGALGFLTFTPSEFSSVSFQVRFEHLGRERVEAIYFLKTTFNIGPHGQHPF